MEIPLSQPACPHPLRDEQLGPIGMDACTGHFPFSLCPMVPLLCAQEAGLQGLLQGLLPSGFFQAGNQQELGFRYCVFHQGVLLASSGIQVSLLALDPAGLGCLW